MRLERLIESQREEREKLLASFEAERQRWEQERQILLDRIQHPESRQVAPGPVIEYDPPKDEAELAYVGQMVPDGISVGMSDD